MPPVPPIPAHLSTPAKSSENSKTPSPKLLPDIPSTTNNSEDAGVAEKPNQNGMAAAEVEVKTPPTVDRARLGEYYEIEVRGFLKWNPGLIVIGLIVYITITQEISTTKDRPFQSNPFAIISKSNDSLRRHIVH
jgi:hypothetical protein